jgi:hypothetical protein
MKIEAKRLKAMPPLEHFLGFSLSILPLPVYYFTICARFGFFCGALEIDSVSVAFVVQLSGVRAVVVEIGFAPWFVEGCSVVGTKLVSILLDNLFIFGSTLSRT